MTTISTATPEWLALRAAADDAARSTVLADDLALLLRPGRLVLHDLGAGTGGMTRWLASRLAGEQHWVLRDGDAGILDRLAVSSVADAGGGPITTDVIVEELAALPIDAFQGASAVTASALLDVVTEAEAERIVAACVAASTPAFFSLTVTGTVTVRPSDRADTALEAAIGSAFDDHQRRDSGGRRMLGPEAVPTVAAMFAAAGWNVRRASTPWRLGPRDEGLIHAWLDGWVGAAVEQRPDLGAAAQRLRDRLRRRVADGGLQVTVPHEDLLAWPS